MCKDIYQNYNQYLFGLLIITFFFLLTSLYFVLSFFIHLKHIYLGIRQLEGAILQFTS